MQRRSRPKADLAVVRPDVSMPGNGLTLAVLRRLAAFVVAPAQSGIKDFPDLAARRLGSRLDQHQKAMTAASARAEA